MTKSDKLESKIRKLPPVLFEGYDGQIREISLTSETIKALTKLIESEKREAWQEGVEFAAMGLTALSQARVHKIPGMNSDKLARAMREALKDGSDETDR